MAPNPAKRGALRALSLTLTLFLGAGMLAPATTAAATEVCVPGLLERQPICVGFDHEPPEVVGGALDAVKGVIGGGPSQPIAIPPCPPVPDQDPWWCSFWPY